MLISLILRAMLDGWQPSCMRLESHLLISCATGQVVRCLLIEPNPESALNEEAGRLFMEDYDSYAQRARLMTGIHATKAEGAACSASTQRAAAAVAAGGESQN